MAIQAPTPSMTIDETRAVMGRYLSDEHAVDGVLADDVVLTVMATRSRPSSPRSARRDAHGPKVARGENTMTPIVRSLTLVAAVLVATSGLAACGSTAPAPSGPSGSGGPGATNLISNLPDLGLRNVTTETAAARAAIVTEADGATITATGSNGAIYTLAIPAGAVSANVQIAIYPIANATNLPGGTAVSAGVQISPDGLQLQAPASFTIQFPPNVDPTRLVGALWNGDVVDAHLYPAVVTGQTMAMHLLHFTAPVAVPNTAPFPVANHCTSSSDMENNVEYDTTHPGPGMRAALTSDLKRCYRDLIEPKLEDSITASHAPFVSRLVPSLVYATMLFEDWQFAIADATSALAPQTLGNLPEVDEATALVAAVDRAWFVAIDKNCLDAEETTADRVDWARTAIDIIAPVATQEGLATSANGLDLASLLGRSCAQIVIDSTRTYSATAPGQTGTLRVSVGVTLAGGPEQPFGMNVKVRRHGGGTVLADQDTDSQGIFEATVQWLVGVDPIELDITATVRQEANGGMPARLSLLSRSDRFSRHSGPTVTPTPSGPPLFTVTQVGGPGPGYACSTIGFVARYANGDPVLDVHWAFQSGPRLQGIGFLADGFLFDVYTGPDPGTYVVVATAGGVSVTASRTVVTYPDQPC